MRDHAPHIVHWVVLAVALAVLGAFVPEVGQHYGAAALATGIVGFALTVVRVAAATRAVDAARAEVVKVRSAVHDELVASAADPLSALAGVLREALVEGRPRQALWAATVLRRHAEAARRTLGAADHRLRGLEDAMRVLRLIEEDLAAPTERFVPGGPMLERLDRMLKKLEPLRAARGSHDGW